MGNTTWLDIIGSMTTFGLLLLTALRLNASASEHSTNYQANYILQRNMVVLTTMLEQDLRHVGANTNATVTRVSPIITADSERFCFSGDLTNDGIIDQVEYFIGLTSELPETPNPNDRYITRIENGASVRMNLGVTKLKFKYYNISDPTAQLPFPITGTTLGNIGPIEIQIELGSPFILKQQYAMDTSQYQMLWKQMRMISRNSTLQTPAR
jgi:hypothetical protein